MDSLPSPHPNPAADPAAADTTHPAWCDPGRCAAMSGGPHCGAPVVIAGDHIGSARLRLHVWSPSDDPGDPVVLVELVASDRDTGRRLRVDLSVWQLDLLRRELAVIAAQVAHR